MFKSFFKKGNNSESESDLYNSLIALIKEILEDNAQEIEINKETVFSEIGFDSVKYINLILQLENLVEADMESIVSEMDISTIVTVGDLFEFLEKIKWNK